MMVAMSENSGSPRTVPRYRWPWFVLGAAVLAVVLAWLWLSREIERTRSQRQWNTPSPTTQPR